MKTTIKLNELPGKILGIIFAIFYFTATPIIFFLSIMGSASPNMTPIQKDIIFLIITMPIAGLILSVLYFLKKIRFIWVLIPLLIEFILFYNLY